MQINECHHPCPIRMARPEGDRRVILFTFLGGSLHQAAGWPTVPRHPRLHPMWCPSSASPYSKFLAYQYASADMRAPSHESSQHACQQRPALSRFTPLQLNNGTSGGASTTETTFEPHMTLGFRSLLHPKNCRTAPPRTEGFRTTNQSAGGG